MINFKSLMKAIHQSIRVAAAEVEEQGVKHVNTFFECVDSDPDDNGDITKVWRPKTYPMEFPFRTDDGIVNRVVEVPWITLSPITSPRITEVTFTTELEVTSNENDELMVAFPAPVKPSMFSKSEPSVLSNAKIEIRLTGNEPPEGLKKIIAGYERALRAQIPG